MRVTWRIFITFLPDKWAWDGLSVLLSHRMFFQGLEKPVPIKVETKGPLHPPAQERCLSQMGFVCVTLVHGDSRGLLSAGEGSDLEPQASRGLEETRHSLRAFAESPMARLLFCVL